MGRRHKRSAVEDDSLTSVFKLGLLVVLGALYMYFDQISDGFRTVGPTNAPARNFLLACYHRATTRRRGRCSTQTPSLPRRKGIRFYSLALKCALNERGKSVRQR